MTEDAEDAGEERNLLAVNLGMLIDQVTDQRLTDCQLHGFSGHLASSPTPFEYKVGNGY